MRLLVESVAALVIAVVADVAGVECIQKLEGAVVNRQAQHAHVVGVHHAVAKAHGLPVRNHVGGALAHLIQQRGIGIAWHRGAFAIYTLPAAAAGGVVAVNHVIGQLAQLGLHIAGGKVLKVAKTDKAGRGTGHDRGGFGRFTVHRGVRSRQAQRARGGNAQGVHGLAAQKFADAGAQHGPPIAAARIRGGACAFELQLPACGGFTYGDGAPVAQLAGPHPKLVAAVDAGIGLAAGQHGIAGEGLQGLLGLHETIGQPCELGDLRALRHPLRIGQGGGLKVREEGWAKA